MVHQLEFAKSFPVQHCHESIKRKFCCEDEEDTIKQRRYIRPIKRVIKKTAENGPVFFPNSGAYGCCYAIATPEENTMMIL
ncbi:hypothetical protein U3516DRAFT_754769 [Neocallimastix sp. 'constans']